MMTRWPLDDDVLPVFILRYSRSQFHRFRRIPHRPPAFFHSLVLHNHALSNVPLATRSRLTGSKCSLQQRPRDDTFSELVADYSATIFAPHVYRDFDFTQAECRITCSLYFILADF